MTLLEEAKKAHANHRKTKYSKEELELFIAVINNEITVAQATKAVKMNNGNIYFRCASALKQAIQDGWIDKIKMK